MQARDPLLSTAVAKIMRALSAELLGGRGGKTLQHVALAAALGARIFRVFGGWLAEKEATDKTYGQISGALTEVGRVAAAHGITVAMENHGGVTRTGAQCARILAGVKVANVRLNDDPANFAFHHEDPYQALTAVKDRVVFTHFKNCREESGVMKYCRLKDGSIHYGPIFRELRTTYHGAWCLEYEEAHDVEAGTRDDLSFLKEYSR